MKYKKVAILRCEKNEERCPLAACFNSLTDTDQRVAEYKQERPAGVFTCRCPGENVASLAKILKAKSANAKMFF
ncbi:MAG: CGGC domain-containing protein [Desulfosalsimonas sp.]